MAQRRLWAGARHQARWHQGTGSPTAAQHPRGPVFLGFWVWVWPCLLMVGSAPGTSRGHAWRCQRCGRTRPPTEWAAPGHRPRAGSGSLRRNNKIGTACRWTTSGMPVALTAEGKPIRSWNGKFGPPPQTLGAGGSCRQKAGPHGSMTLGMPGPRCEGSTRYSGRAARVHPLLEATGQTPHVG
jgi:hypothetical protein